MTQKLQFSANLGLLWSELSLTHAIYAAKSAGFAAVECHWPYDTPVSQVKSALNATGLPMLGINTAGGDLEQGEFGLCALPNRRAEAQHAIVQAVQYAAEIGANHIHAMAGCTCVQDAQTAFLDNLKFACELSAPHGILVLVEPINTIDAPGYFLSNTNQARDIIEMLALPNLKLMFDIYHVHKAQENVASRLQELLPIIGHIQFASVPDRGPPDTGEPDYLCLFKFIRDLGYDRPLGAEYKPLGRTEESLNWMNRFRRSIKGSNIAWRTWSTRVLKCLGFGYAKIAARISIARFKDWQGIGTCNDRCLERFPIAIYPAAGIHMWNWFSL